jgi:hypothetical protein
MIARPIFNELRIKNMMSNLAHRLHRLSLAVAVLATSATAAAADVQAVAQTMPAQPAAPDQGTAAANPGPSISGFRTAQFGMTEAEVRHAIATGFSLPASAISQGVNGIQHTDVLSANVPNLVPGGGTASVSYVFGYQSHKLIEVNVLWSRQIDPSLTPQQLYQNGESLQQYFAGEGFPPQRSAGNIATASGILLFRATDPSGNAVLLILSGTTTKDPKSQDKSFLNPTALTLAYAADAQHPDVFQLNKGSF